ncbi:MAG: hypothetical protein JRJ15_04190 [Deltaproteobacteria bacterium]|nr:hypothetical protein [Deltaproteobacteria bacterium]
MIKSIWLFFVLGFFCPASLMGSPSLMVERHMFSPEPDRGGSIKSPLSLKLEKQLVFTGVIISAQGKWAMIRGKENIHGGEGRGILKEGDEIKGMVINKIGSNFLILTGKDKEVRLNLYHEGKPRPSGSAEHETDAVPIARRSSGALPAASKSEPKDKPRNPFAEAMKKIIKKKSEKDGSASTPATNPFLDAIYDEEGNRDPSL